MQRRDTKISNDQGPQGLEGSLGAKGTGIVLFLTWLSFLYEQMSCFLSFPSFFAAFYAALNCLETHDGTPAQLSIDTSSIQCNFVLEMFYVMYGHRNHYLKVMFLYSPARWLPRLLVDYTGGMYYFPVHIIQYSLTNKVFKTHLNTIKCGVLQFYSST